jgi:hypothetical protein
MYLQVVLDSEPREAWGLSREYISPGLELDNAAVTFAAEN